SRPRRADQLRPLPPVAVDAAVAAGCYLATVAGPGKAAAGPRGLFVLAAVAAVPLGGGGRGPPVGAAGGGGGAPGGGPGGGRGTGALPYGQLVATYTCAALSAPGWRLLAVVGTAAGIVGSALAVGQRPSLIGVTALPFAVAYALGLGARARRDRIAMLEERTRRLVEAPEAAAGP